MTDRLIQYHSDRFQSKIESDASMLTNQEKDLVTLAMNKEWTNPRFKLRWFVGQTQITPFAKLRQWLLEIKGKEEAIENMEYEIAKWDNEIAKLKRDRDYCSDEIDKKGFDIEIWNKERLQTTTKRRLQDWYLERQQLIDLTNELLQSEEGKTVDGRSLLDVLNTKEEDEFEKEYWINRLAKQASCDMMFYGRIGTGNMDAILSLDPKTQAEVFQLTQSFSSQLQKYQLDLQKEADRQLGHQTDTMDLKLPNEQETQPLVNAELNADTNGTKKESEELTDVYNL